MNRRVILIGAAVGLSLPAAFAEAPRDARRAIEAANTELRTAYGRGEARAVAAMYTEGGQLYPPNQGVVAGRAAIEEFWKATMDSGVKGVELKTVEVESLGDSAVEAGTYTLHGKDGTTLDRGKYLVHWKKEGGAWRLHRDCWNSNEPVRRKEPTKTTGLLKVECHLNVAERSGSSAGDFAGEFTLKNSSTEPVQIEYHCHPTTLLDLEVKDESGKILPRCIEAYGFIYSPVHADPDVLTIKPGDSYRTRVRLFIQVDERKHPIVPGKYTVEATYKWQPAVGMVASLKSNKVTIEVGAN
jgi:uncharacterized protein (TIGR02246 family)